MARSIDRPRFAMMFAPSKHVTLVLFQGRHEPNYHVHDRTYVIPDHVCVFER
jgi:hypothetical protein